MRYAFLAFLVAVCFGLGCASDPHECVIPPDSTQWASNEELKEAVEKLTPEENEALTRYLLRKSLSGEGLPPMGVSIQDAIAEQQEWDAEQAREEAEAAALAERIRVEKEAKVKTLRDAVTVAVAEMKYVPEDWSRDQYDDSISITVAFENHSEKAVSGVKGAVRFSDLFGDEIKTVALSYDGGIEANSTASWRATLEYNQFVAEDVKLGSTPLDKIKVMWEPETILYVDGTVLSAE